MSNYRFVKIESHNEEPVALFVDRLNASHRLALTERGLKARIDSLRVRGLDCSEERSALEQMRAGSLAAPLL